MIGNESPNNEGLTLVELVEGLEEDIPIYVRRDGNLVITQHGADVEEVPLTLSKPRQIWY